MAENHHPGIASRFVFFQERRVVELSRHELMIFKLLDLFLSHDGTYHFFQLWKDILNISEAVLTHASSYQWAHEQAMKLWKNVEREMANISWQFNNPREKDSVRVLVKSILENMGRLNACSQEQKAGRSQKLEGILAGLQQPSWSATKSGWMTDHFAAMSS